MNNGIQTDVNFTGIYEMTQKRIKYVFDQNKKLKPKMYNQPINPDGPVVISINNHKGGTGKTMLSYMLGWYLAATYPERKVLLVDTDLVIVSLTSRFRHFGLELSDTSLSDVLYDEAMQEYNVSFDDSITHVVNNLYLAGGTEIPNSKFVDIQNERPDGYILNERLYESEFLEDNPIVIIDSGSDTYISDISMRAAHHVIGAIHLGSGSTTGISTLLKHLSSLDKNLLGIATNHYTKSAAVRDDLENILRVIKANPSTSKTVFYSPIPMKQSIANSQYNGYVPTLIFPQLMEIHKSIIDVYK